MVRVIFAAWIPRSYLHVYEAARKVKSIPVKVTGVEVKDGISFNVEDNDFKASFELNGSGLYTLSGVVRESEIEDFKTKAENILLHKIIRTCHTVTYKQLLSKTLPLTKASAVISGKGTYYDLHNPYAMDSVTYVKEKDNAGVREAVKIHLQAILFGQFFYSMMDRMEMLYHSATEISDMLEKEGKLEDIKRAVFGMDLVKKNVAESNAKIGQSTSILENASENVKKIRGVGGKVLKSLGTEKIYERVNADKDYIIGLWALLIAFLDNLDAAAEARLSYQETMESRLIETILGGELAVAIAVVIVGVFFSESIGWAGIITIVLIFVVWIILRNLLKGVHTKIGRIKKLDSG